MPQVSPGAPQALKVLAQIFDIGWGAFADHRQRIVNLGAADQPKRKTKCTACGQRMRYLH